MDNFIRAFDSSEDDPIKDKLIEFCRAWPPETGERVSPLRGTIWRHYKGGIYTVLGRAKNGSPWFLSNELFTVISDTEWLGSSTPQDEALPSMKVVRRTPNGVLVTGTSPASNKVVYLCSRTGKTWIRDLSEWHEEVEVGGMNMPRFQHFSGGAK